jgi:pimeloyl-ACP methyl ester carboxylesterase
MAATHTIKVPHLGGIQVGYAISGDGTPDVLKNGKPTCVLINALHTTVAFWRPQFEDEKLTSSANLLAIEPLGHGATVCPATDDFTYWDTATMALQVMEKLGVERAFAMGTSQGGFIVARMALLAPERVSRQIFIVVHCYGIPETEAGLPFFFLIRSRESYPSVHQWTTSQSTRGEKVRGTLTPPATRTWSVGPAPSPPRTLSSMRTGAEMSQPSPWVTAAHRNHYSSGTTPGGSCTVVTRGAGRPGQPSRAWSREMVFFRDCPRSNAQFIGYM